MRYKTIFFTLGITIISLSIFSQPTDYNNARPFKETKASKDIGYIEERSGLGYFSDPAENLFDVYHYGNFPDSLYYYYNDNGINGLSLYGKQYFIDESKTVRTAVNSYSQDIYHYNESGLLDSAILVSEADQEYDDYAIKHIYTYNDGLMATEAVSVDNINDSVNDDWNSVQKIDFTYNANLRIKEKLIEHMTWQPDVRFEKNVYYYSDSSLEGITQTDTCFVVNTNDEKIASQIAIKKFNSTNLCMEEKYFQFESSYLLKPDSFGTPAYVKKIVMEYDNNKNLLSEEITYNYNAQPSGYKNIYELNTNGTRKLKTVYQNFDNSWYLAYQYQYFYKLSETNIIDAEDTELKIFPNPVNDILNIEGITVGSDVIIYSVDGKIVRDKINSDGYITVSKLPAGVYIIKIIDNNNKALYQTIIKK